MAGIQRLALPEEANKVVLCLLHVTQLLRGKLRRLLALLLESQQGLLIESGLRIYHGHVQNGDVPHQLGDFADVTAGLVLACIICLLFEVLQIPVEVQVPLVVPHEFLGHAEEKGG